MLIASALLLAVSSQQTRGSRLETQRDALQQQIQAARKSTQEIKQQEQASAKARGQLQRAQGDPPAGSALVWLPSRIKRHFDRAGIRDSVTRLNTAADEPRIPGYERTYWAVDLPLSGTPDELRLLLRAVSTLEEAEPAVLVIDLGVRVNPETQLRAGVINISALSPK